MERTMSKGLALEELEAHSYAELLPDRIELRHWRHRHHHRDRHLGAFGFVGGFGVGGGFNIGGFSAGGWVFL